METRWATCCGIKMDTSQWSCCCSLHPSIAQFLNRKGEKGNFLRVRKSIKGLIRLPPHMIFVGKVRTFWSTFHWEPLHIDPGDTTMNGLTPGHSLFWVAHMFVRQISHVNVTWYSIIKPQPYPCCLTWTPSSIKMIPHLQKQGLLSISQVIFVIQRQ
jgi:hypothetical protein